MIGAIVYLLGRVPGWLWAILLAVILIYAGITSVRLDEAHDELAQERTARAEEKQAAADAALRLSNQYREQEAAREAEKEATVREAQENARIAAADAAAARQSADGLRKQLNAYVAANRGATSNSGAGTGGASAGSQPDAVDLLSDLFIGADEVAGELAIALDRARIAGLACERSYDALTD